MLTNSAKYINDENTIESTIRAKGIEKSVNRRNINLIKQKGSLLSEHPDICKFWNYAKNNELTPEQFRPSSNKKVWWICENGHEYEQSIEKKVNGRGCPYCSNKKVLKGYNDLATTNPDLLKASFLS